MYFIIPENALCNRLHLISMFYFYFVTLIGDENYYICYRTNLSMMMQMRNMFLLLILFMIGVLDMDAATITISRIDPAYWYVGMKQTELQLMVYGPDIRRTDVKVDDPLVTLKEIVRLDSPNYLLVYLNVPTYAPSGKVKLIFTFGKKKLVKYYELKQRNISPDKRIGFDSSDVLYMLMPDRFANGDSTNDQIKGMLPYKVNREDPNARHGGDLAGIEKHLNYFADLGVTALWFTPVLENDMEGGSYHGYATTDYYKIDPRLGSNEEYRKLVDEAHADGLKVVMDMIFNHCGSEHPWIKDMPSKDWFNHPDYKKHFVQTSYRLTPIVDPYASKYDKDLTTDGWFVQSMPDLNQTNPHVMRYLIQNSKFWIEYAGIDGIRMDTYPYADYDAMASWMKEINDEYPNFNVVGETWVTQPAYTAYWQKDSKLSAPRNSNLKTVMDFSFWDKMNQAKHEETDTDHGLGRIYNNFVYDYLYKDPLHVMAFFENHDTDRFLGNSQDFAILKQAYVLLLTMPRIPQLYYGTEVMMNGVKNISDGYVRKDFPGGWQSDKRSAFTYQGRTKVQNDMYNFVKNILHWRQGNKLISKGSMIHFAPQNGIYVYQRAFKGKRVLVILNGTSQNREMNLTNYQEVLKDCLVGHDIIGGEQVDLAKNISLLPRQSMILDLDK
jgi:neopullulanase